MEYRPYVVHIRLGAPVALAHPWIAGDALLEHLAFSRRLGRQQYNLPPFTPAPHRGDDPYANLVYSRAGLRFASVVELGPEPKAGTLEYYCRPDDALPKRRIPLGMGQYRAWAMRWVYIAAEWARIWAYGRPELATELVADLVGVGNDTRVGWGYVIEAAVEEVPEDRSVVWEGRAQRPIPVRFLRSYSDAVQLAWMPPYWDSASVELCAPPGAEVDFGGSPRSVLRKHHWSPPGG